MRTLERSLYALEADRSENSSLTVRVVGPFSAGKTRLIQELLKEDPDFPETLMPVSSPEPQTLFPLEVTFGRERKLELIEREGDGDLRPRVLQEFAYFPSRDDIPHDEHREHRRIRLQVPLDALMSKTGGRRIHLLDTQGWGASEGADKPLPPERRIPKDSHNLALILVLSNIQREHRGTLRDFQAYLEPALDSMDPFAKEHPLLLVVLTNCDPDPRLEESEMLPQIEKAWSNLVGLNGRVEKRCIDFGKATPDVLYAFRRDIWELIESADEAEDDAVSLRLQRSRETSTAILDAIEITSETFNQVHRLLLTSYQDGNFFHRLNQSRMRGYCNRGTKDYETRRDELLDKHFSINLGSTTPLALLQNWISKLSPGLQPELDPLSEFRNRWAERVEVCAAPCRCFLTTLREKIKALGPDVTISQEYWAELVPLRQKALDVLRASTFPMVLNAASTIPKDTPREVVLATILRILLMEAYFLEITTAKS